MYSLKKKVKDEYGYPITTYTKEGDPVVKELVQIPVPYLKDEVISLIHYLHDNRKKLKEMIAKLFDIENGKVIPTEHCYTLKSLKI